MFARKGFFLNSDNDYYYSQEYQLWQKIENITLNITSMIRYRACYLVNCKKFQPCACVPQIHMPEDWPET